jgi:hypothetical protein
VHGVRDVGEVLEELGGGVLVRPVVLSEDERDLQQASLQQPLLVSAPCRLRWLLP